MSSSSPFSYLDALVVEGTPQVFDAATAMNNPATDGSLLSCRYDLKRLAKEFPRDRIAAGGADLWRYAPLLPVGSAANIVSLGEGWTPLLETPRLGRAHGLPRLRIKDESRNPSGSFKDRGAAVAISRLIELGVTRFGLHSSGNAAAAWSLYAARAGVQCANVLPFDVPDVCLAQTVLGGSDTYLLEGDWGRSGAYTKALTLEQERFFVGTLAEPWRVEGKKTIGLEIAEQLGWRLPDAIVYPVGGGLGIIAIYKAFRELIELGWIAPQALPKLIVTQFEGCAPIVRAFDEHAERATPWLDIQIPPGGMRSARPPGDRAVLALVRDTQGAAIAVSAGEAAEAASLATRLEGLFVGTECGTSLAALEKGLARGTLAENDEVVVVSTAGGLKSLGNFPLAQLRQGAHAVA
jgi:threonine synthase